MRVLRGFLEIAPEVTASAVTIGNFDGVHRGHQAVIHSAVDDARRAGGASIACTFDPHTRAFLTPEAPPRLLETLDQRLAAIAALGVDVAVVIPFTGEVASLPREAFVGAFLRDTLHARVLHLSDDFKFGTGGRGNVGFLRGVAEEHGFTVEVIPPVIEGGQPISSTRVRDAVAAGRVDDAAALLGRPFTLVGNVVKGAGRGRSLGAPTANILPENGCLPAAGVYVTEIDLGEGKVPAVTNVGVRPTFGKDGAFTVESHVLDRNEDLYGSRLELGFLQRLRDEQAFDSPAALADQITRDVSRARVVFASRAENLRYTQPVSGRASAGRNPPREPH